VANAKTGGSTLVAVTTKGEFFFLAACNIADQGAKLFAIQQDSYSEGIAKLRSKAMETVITGGTVKDCVLINLTNGAAAS
jgi:hypothetical protein